MAKKKCLHCAEEIQEDAGVCRYCSRPVPTGAVSIAHRGSKLLLGETATGYAIWEAASGQRVAEEFPRTPDGWRQAWYRFQGVESREAQQANPAAWLIPSIVLIIGIFVLLALVGVDIPIVSDLVCRVRGGMWLLGECVR